MELRFVKRRFKDAEYNELEINGAQIVHRNFRGEGGPYNTEGNRNFSVVIPNPDIAKKLQEDKNEYGVGWNVKIKAPLVEGDGPFMYLPVKLKFNSRGPKVILDNGLKRIRLNEDEVACLDYKDILYVDMDIRPYDDISHGVPFRAAYVNALWVVQDADRFDVRMAEEEHPEE